MPVGPRYYAAAKERVNAHFVSTREGGNVLEVSCTIVTPRGAKSPTYASGRRLAPLPG